MRSKTDGFKKKQRKEPAGFVVCPAWSRRGRSGLALERAKQSARPRYPSKL